MNSASVKSLPAAPYLLPKEALDEYIGNFYKSLSNIPAGNSEEIEELVTATALRLLERRAIDTKEFFTSSKITKEYFRLLLGEREAEVFCVAYLTSQHQLICVEEMFTGTIDGAAVYPREIVKGALKKNAAAIIISHNHPSGISKPSEADIRITGKIKEALATVDIRLLDHVVVSNIEATTLSETGDL